MVQVIVHKGFVTVITVSHTKQLPFSPWNYGLRSLTHTSMLMSTPSFSSLDDIVRRCVMTCVRITFGVIGVHEFVDLFIILQFLGSCHQP